MLDETKLISDAALAQFAAGVIAAMTPEARDAILMKSIMDALTSYSVRQQIEAAVAASTVERTAELLATAVVRGQIDAACRKGINEFLARLPGAIVGALQEAFAGKAGDSYERGPGLLLKHMNGKK